MYTYVHMYYFVVCKQYLIEDAMGRLDGSIAVVSIQRKICLRCHLASFYCISSQHPCLRENMCACHILEEHYEFAQNTGKRYELDMLKCTNLSKMKIVIKSFWWMGKCCPYVCMYVCMRTYIINSIISSEVYKYKDLLDEASGNHIIIPCRDTTQKKHISTY